MDPTTMTVPALEFLTPHALTNLPKIPGGWADRAYEVVGRKILLTGPEVPDKLLDDPAVIERHGVDGYMPYWGYLWPTALEMAQALFESPFPKGLPVLEIGAGLGLAGIAGLMAGLEVLFSDYDRLSVRIALLNAARNGFPEARGIFLDWCDPPPLQFPLILGCDVIYEARNHAPILDLCQRMLAPGGVCWLADAGRHQAPAFVELAQKRGFGLEQRRIVRIPFPGRPEGFTDLYVVTNPK